MTSRTPRGAGLETTPATLTHDDVAINSYQGDFRDLSDLVRLVEGTLNPQVLASNPRFRRLVSTRDFCWACISRRGLSGGEFHTHLDRLDRSGRACLESDAERQHEQARDEEPARSEHQDSYALDDVGRSTDDATEHAPDGRCSQLVTVG